MGRWVVMVLLELALGGAAAAAPPDPALIQRQHRAALDLERDGQALAARDAFRRIVEADPEGPRAADALLGIARLAWPVDDPSAAVGRPPDPAAAEEARSCLERIGRRFPHSEAAAEALWRLALLHLAPGGPLWDPERALALLTTLPRLHPEAREAPQAVALAAELQLAAGRTARARGLAFRTLADWPLDPVAPAAWLILVAADAREGRLEQALVEAGRAQAAAAGRSVREAARALGLATLLDRALFSKQRGQRALAADRGPGVAAPGRVRDLAVGLDGELWIATAGDGRLTRIPREGGAPEISPAPGVAAVAVDRWGRLWWGGGAHLEGPHGVGALAGPERLEIVALAAADARAAWVADGRSRRLLRLESGKGVTASAQLAERAQVAALAPGAQGGVWALDVRNTALTEFAADGAVKGSIALTALARNPVDLDVDELGHLYVLDAAAPAVLVFAPGGGLVIRQPLEREGEPSFARPTALAVGRFGAVAVYDARKKGITWLR